TLYHYIATKEEILFECVQRGLDALRAAIDETAGRDIGGREKLRAVLRAFPGGAPGRVEGLSRHSTHLPHRGLPWGWTRAVSLRSREGTRR
ncbi:MAG TPA: hypothetical protein VHA82_07030, partial [Ramlibacter sp.]|uniref:TetR/AcrR family transcriptional regulator n=1 Tax=Ramlibacter sp. TaxID=1917967 RepID=UPI002B50C3A2|nr:hypothetical protein [Ramlibacter sp.]